MSSPAKSKKLNFSELLKQIAQDYPKISFQEADAFRWSAESQTVYYNSTAEYASWSLLHELGHMISNHSIYHTDAMLVRMEVEAWRLALEIASKYNHSIDEDYIQDCIDSYRGWQYERSMCPVCEQTGIEKSDGNYRCINCANTWKVSHNRFCRVYRRRTSGNTLSKSTKN